MPAGRPNLHRVVLDEQRRAQLEALARSRSLAHSLVRRARIVLMAAAVEPNASIARQVGVARPTVTLWCRRFCEQGIEGLYDMPASGRPRTYDDEVASLIQRAIDERPEEATHSTVRGFAEATGTSKSTVHRYFKLFGL